MREIKFRGISEGKWNYGLLTFMFGSYAIVDPKDENTVHLVDEKTIGQYTGLKDKNGIEIYEGDIVEADIAGIDAYSIVFVKGRFTMQSVLGGKDSLWILDEKCEVIGNIYENPELLEETK